MSGWVVVRAGAPVAEYSQQDTAERAADVWNTKAKLGLCLPGPYLARPKAYVQRPVKED